MTIPIYYAGYDPGSAFASLFTSGADGTTHLLTIPSFVADEPLISRSWGQSKGRESISYKDFDYFVGQRALDGGQNSTNASGDRGRYSGLHSQLLLFALVAALIPETDVELRLVTALPVNLHEKENRQATKRVLSGHHRFIANGVERSLIVKVGTVIMEGQGILMHYAKENVKDQAVVDIGERTTGLVAIDHVGNPIKRFVGETELGVGQVVNELRETIRLSFGRFITTSLAHKMLRASVQHAPLPVVKANNVAIPTDSIVGVIDKAIERVGRSINTFISSKWNVEGVTIGSNFDAISIAGGGAYYFTDIIRRQLMTATMTDDPEHANVQGYHDLALGLESLKETVWR